MIWLENCFKKNLQMILKLFKNVDDKTNEFDLTIIDVLAKYSYEFEKNSNRSFQIKNVFRDDYRFAKILHLFCEKLRDIHV